MSTSRTVARRDALCMAATAGKLFFALFLERARAFHFIDGLSTGRATYIATGRKAIVESSFCSLYAQFARSHLHFAFELGLLVAAFAVFSVQPGMTVLVYMFPVLICIVSLLLSPWLFNAKSFESLTIRTHFYEFLAWLESSPDSAITSGHAFDMSWTEWHENALAGQRAMPRATRILRALMSILSKIALLYGATASLRVRPHNNPSVRCLLVLFCAMGALFLSVCFQMFSQRRFVGSLFGKKRYWAHMAYRWMLRVLFVSLYVILCWGVTFRAAVASAAGPIIGPNLGRCHALLCIEETPETYVSTYRKAEFEQGGLSDFAINTCAAVVIGIAAVAATVQAFAVISPPVQQHHTASPIMLATSRYVAHWYRELDYLVSIVLYSLLLLLSFLPIAYVHSRVLFNRAYASEVARIAQRKTTLLVARSLNIAGSLRRACASSRFAVRRLSRACFRFGRCICHPLLGRNAASASQAMRMPAGSEADQMQFYSAETSAPAEPLAPSKPDDTMSIAGGSSVFHGPEAPPDGAHKWPQVDDELASPGPEPEAPPPAPFCVVLRGGAQTSSELQQSSDIPGGFGRNSAIVDGTSAYPQMRRASQARRTTIAGRLPLNRTTIAAAAAPSYSEPEEVYMLIGDLSLPMRQTLIRVLLEPVAAYFVARFGFQMEHAEGSSGGSTPSNTSNQIEHIVALLSHRMDAMCDLSFQIAFESAVHALHDKLLANWMHWARHVRLPSRVRAASSRRHFGANPRLISLADLSLSPWDFTVAEEGGMFLCNQRLHRIVLYLFLWGEAGNVRHLPECLCYILHCAMGGLLLRDTTGSHTVQTEVPSSPVVWNAAIGRAMDEKVAPVASAGEYLESIIVPLYSYLQWQLVARSHEHIQHRVMYDDVNECFWQRTQLETINQPLLSSIPREAEGAVLTAYTTLQQRLAQTNMEDGATSRDALVDGEDDTIQWRKRMSTYFKKTYREKTSWTHVYHIFYRVISWHIITLHILWVVAFVGPFWSCVADFGSPLPTHIYCKISHTQPRDNGLEVGLSTACITHSLCKVCARPCSAPIFAHAMRAFSMP